MLDLYMEAGELEMGKDELLSLNSWVPHNVINMPNYYI
jgi:hypothetical protein